MILVSTAIPWYGKMLIALCKESLQVCGNGCWFIMTLLYWTLEIGNRRFDTQDISEVDFSPVLGCFYDCFYPKVRCVSWNVNRDLLNTVLQRQRAMPHDNKASKDIIRGNTRINVHAKWGL